MSRGDNRDYELKRKLIEWRAWYLSSLWRSIRKKRLSIEPMCRKCKGEGASKRATVVDHIDPHRGERAKFFSFENTQSLCASHHNSWKQSVERRGFDRSVGADGWPTDPKHPSNRKT